MSIDIIYLSNYLDENTALGRGIKVYSHAANNKIINFALSFKPWQKVAILSTGRGRAAEKHGFHNSVIVRQTGIPIYYAAFFYFPWVSYLLSAFSLACWVARLYRKYPKAVYVIYGSRPIYLVALFLISVLQIRCYLDLEDGSSEFRKQGPIQEFLDRALIKIFDHVCKSGALIACEYLRQETRIKKIMPYYGVAIKKNTTSRDWHVEKLQVIFGGTLRAGAGTSNFMEAVSILHKNYPEIANQYLFVITGLGAMAEQVKVFSEQFDNTYVEFRGNLPKHKFHEIMNKTHIGLNLRNKSFLIAHDTFPSKVMDMTCYGQLIISTKTSDVPTIFNQEFILLVEDIDLTRSLIDKLIWVAKNRQDAEKMAELNQEDMLYRFSPSKTAQELINFFK